LMLSVTFMRIDTALPAAASAVALHYAVYKTIMDRLISELEKPSARRLHGYTLIGYCFQYGCSG